MTRSIGSRTEGEIGILSMYRDPIALRHTRSGSKGPVKDGPPVSHFSKHTLYIYCPFFPCNSFFFASIL